jgi:DNA-binding transcriptional MerR regulator
LEAHLTASPNRGAAGGASQAVAVAASSGLPASRTPDAVAVAVSGHGANPGSIRSAAELPDRRYFRIGEVAVLLGVKPYVLRYWETEFPQVRPQKSRSGQRLYRRREVELLLGIRHLLYERQFTIAGARKALKEVDERTTPGVLDVPPPGTPVPSKGRAPSLPPSPLSFGPLQAPEAGPSHGPVPLPSLTPHRSQQLSLALSHAEAAVLEELRDGIRELLSLSRES